jgi:DNA-binding LytR/AlgR family response regulator
MVKICILEDEPAAQRRLKRIVHELRPDWNIAAIRDSVESGIELLERNTFDLILSDIQLSDGTCFDIFKKVNTDTPIIFITAYDEYAIKAFDFNSIHYLVKPITSETLHLALSKFEQNQLGSGKRLLDAISEDDASFHFKILSKVGTKTLLINPKDIAFIYAANRITKCYLFDGNAHYLDQSLDKLMNYLPEDDFFRINRQFIVQFSAIKKYQRYSSNRLLLSLGLDTSHELIVSKEKAPLFKRWISRV